VASRVVGSMDTAGHSLLEPLTDQWQPQREKKMRDAGMR
jgi:hypothetical protein